MDEKAREALKRYVDYIEELENRVGTEEATRLLNEQLEEHQLPFRFTLRKEQDGEKI